MERDQAYVVWIGVSAALAAVGAIGPWATVLGSSVSGVDGSNDGWIVLVAAALGVLSFFGRRPWRSAGTGPLLSGAVVVAVTIYDRQHLQAGINHAGPLAQALVHVGWGLNLALVAGISLGIAGLLWRRTALETAHEAEVRERATGLRRIGAWFDGYRD